MLARIQPGAGTLGALAAVGVLALLAAAGFRRCRRRREEEVRALEVRAQALEGDLRETEARLKAVFRYAPAAMAVKDMDGRLVILNKRAEALMGVCQALTPAEAGARLFAAGQVAQGAAQDERVVRRKEVVQAEETITLPSGGTREYLIQKFPIVDGQEQCRGLGIIATNVTERKRDEQAHLQRQKLESLGLLAGGIAHDFNNLLGAMLGVVELAALERGPMDHLRTLEDLITRSSGLVAQMLAYAGKGTFRAQALDLNHHVEEVLAILRTPLQGRAILRWLPAPSLPPIQGDVGQVQQVIINLVMNAAEAMDPFGGVITLRTAHEDLGEAALDRFGLGDSLNPGPYVVLEVADTGPGMSPDLQERIFDPFFTTKFAGRGLGLSAVQGILRSHQGGIQVSSEEGSGSTFKVVFPALPGQVTQGVPASTGVEGFRGTGLVLVVDDEDAIRTVAARALQHLGFTTLEARDGLEALLLFEAEGERIRLILMDLTMPHMGGEDACRGLRRAGSIAPIILASGFGPEEARGRLADTALAGFLQKPYRLESLVGAVRDVLEGVSPRERNAYSRDLTSWAETLRTGNEVLDTQHRQLGEAFSRLVPGGAASSLEPLLELMASHFRAEEEAMAAGDYPFRRSHVAAHARIMRAFRNVEGWLKAGDASLTAARLDAMEDGVRNHLQSEDMELALFLRRV